jgi:hypothetical protein
MNDNDNSIRDSNQVVIKDAYKDDSGKGRVRIDPEIVNN